MISKETAPAPNVLAHTALPKAKRIIARMEYLRTSWLGWHSSGNWPSGMGGFGSGLHHPYSARTKASRSKSLWLHSFFEPRLAQDVLGRTNMHMFASCVSMNAIFWARWDCCIDQSKITWTCKNLAMYQCSWRFKRALYFAPLWIWYGFSGNGQNLEEKGQTAKFTSFLDFWSFWVILC